MSPPHGFSVRASLGFLSTWVLNSKQDILRETGEAVLPFMSQLLKADELTALVVLGI